MTASTRPTHAPVNRTGLLIMLALAAILALTSFWILEVMRRTFVPDTPGSEQNIPDYYVEKFTFLRLAKNGQPQYNLSGERLTHLPRDNSYAIDLPVIHSLNPERPPMASRAQRAIVEQESNQVHLYEDVRIDRPATTQASAFHLKSEYLLLLPDDDVMKTDQPVQISLGTSRLSGIGMYANNATRELRLANQVHMTYRPPLVIQPN